jgi:hypothetical protein
MRKGAQLMTFLLSMHMHVAAPPCSKSAWFVELCIDAACDVQSGHVDPKLDNLNPCWTEVER